MRLVLIAILSSRLLAEEIEVYPEWRTVPEEVQEIADLERMIENKLRDDQHNHTVSLDIDESIERMEKLIKDAEEIEENSPESHRKRDLLDMKNGGNKPDRKPPKVAGTDAKAGVHYDSKDIGEWARLPRSQRGEIVQVWASDLPLLWKKRIESYFLSVNADDTKKAEKKTEKDKN